MGGTRVIDSLHNPLVKKAVLLKEKVRWRRKTGLFVLEGLREIEMALKSGIILEEVLFYPGILARKSIEELTAGLEVSVVEVSREVYQRIAYRVKTEGIVAVARSRSHHLKELTLRRKEPLILVAETLEKPGNIGALLRTADAAALDAVIIANPNSDLYNPNIIRSSMGCLFSVPIAMGSSQEVITFLQQKGITTFAAELGASSRYSDMDFRKAAAIVVGSESGGLSEDWLEAADHNILIPMQGQIDSMNVSVSAAILIFEAMRQRDFK